MNKLDDVDPTVNPSAHGSYFGGGFGRPNRVIEERAARFDDEDDKTMKVGKYAPPTKPGMHTAHDGKMAFIPDMATLGPRFAPAPEEVTRKSAFVKLDDIDVSNDATRPTGFYVTQEKAGRQVLRYWKLEISSWLSGGIYTNLGNGSRMLFTPTALKTMAAGQVIVSIHFSETPVRRCTWADALIVNNSLGMYDSCPFEADLAPVQAQVADIHNPDTRPAGWYVLANAGGTSKGISYYWSGTQFNFGGLSKNTGETCSQERLLRQSREEMPSNGCNKQSPVHSRDTWLDGLMASTEVDSDEKFQHGSKF